MPCCRMPGMWQTHPSLPQRPLLCSTASEALLLSLSAQAEHGPGFHQPPRRQAPYVGNRAVRCVPWLEAKTALLAQPAGLRSSLLGAAAALLQPRGGALAAGHGCSGLVPSTSHTAPLHFICSLCLTPAATLSEGEKRYSRFESGNRYGDTPFANRSSKVCYKPGKCISLACANTKCLEGSRLHCC